MEHDRRWARHFAWKRAWVTCWGVMALAVCLLLPGNVVAAKHATQVEAYQACMIFAKLNYEARIVPFYAQKYKCVQGTNPLSNNAYIGAIWAKNCKDCPYFWSVGYGIEEWPLKSVVPERNVGPPCCRYGTDAGNPINFGAGNKYETAIDIDRRGLLGFTRYYNSLPIDRTVRPLGPGWTHTYLARIEQSDSLIPGRWAKVYRPDGGVSFFVYQSDGIWLPDAGSDDNLIEVRASDGATLGWQYQPAQRDRTENFDARGRLTKVIDRSADWIELEYNDASAPGTQRDFLVTRVVDRQGRSLQLAYGQDGQLARIDSADGAIYGYGYDATGMLSTVSFPDNTSRGYRYNEAAYTASTNQPSALTGVIDESGQRYATFRYDSTGKATQTEHAGGVGRYSATYNSTSNTVPLYGPLGALQSRDFTSQWGVRTAVSTTDQCPGCTTGSVLYQYDNSGKLDWVRDQKSTWTNHDFNAWGGETQRVEAYGKPEQRTVQTDFDPELRLPTERRLLNASGATVLRSTWTRNARGQELTESLYDAVTSEVRVSSRTHCEQAQVDAGTCPMVGLLISTNGPRSDVNDETRFDYYATDHPSCSTQPSTCSWRKGDLWKVTNAKGQVTETTRYDGAGRVLSAKDSNGVITDFQYDPRGRMTGRTTRASN